MNAMDELRDSRPAHLADRAVDPATRSAELSHAMAGARRSGRARRRARPAWGLGLLGAAAALTAAAVVVVNGTGGAPRVKPGVAQPAPTQSSSRPVELSARQILLAAAERAESTKETTGAYWHTASVNRSLFQADGFRLLEQSRLESWTPSAVGGEQWSRSTPLGARPATPEDEAAWRAAGSPAKVAIDLPGKPKGSFMLPIEPGRAELTHAPLVDGDKVFWLGRNVTMKDLRGLPAEPGALKKWLLRSYAGHDTESSSKPMSSDAWLFAVSAGLIVDMPVTPQVRGAAFRMLADLDSIKVIPEVTDAEGRTGSAVAVEQPAQAKAGDPGKAGVLEDRLIVDVSTGQALARENVVVEPGGRQAGFAPGTVWNSQAVLTAGWTDTEPND
ncbi:CU044_5270 family protein [Nonomuraea sp. NN258]|uniref:CU044_5270 family protein n=1 Tax=Nonomuraea antri TaxID=2730852 RepID=UPI00156A4A29|nr:CU044_5270 family protein [Nonomuraea antri]NRQ37964.1 CU044_5270 family protein [Nonomuraea antri]